MNYTRWNLIKANQVISKSSVEPKMVKQIEGRE